MSDFKVLTVVGTRPEIIKLSEVIKRLDNSLDHTLVHTGQNYDYELNEVFFKDLDIRKPDIFLEANKGTPAETIGDIIAKSDAVIKEVKPDAFLIYGDTNSCLSAISAKRNKIPIFHMEAGNRCFDQRVPEEINRKIVDHLSDINMTISEHARNYLVSEGIRPETIIKIGSSMKEVLDINAAKIQESKVLESEELNPYKYLLVSLHREENLDSEENFKNFLETIEAIEENYKMPIIISTHPRTKKRLDKIGYENTSSLIRFTKPFGFHDYVKLQMKAFCVISDSGTITEEASILNLPAITIRDAHERPEGMDEGVLIMSGLKKDDVIRSIEVILTNRERHKSEASIVKDYDSLNVSKKVLRIILSYTNYVNRLTWHK